MIDWKTPDTETIGEYKRICPAGRWLGSDTTPANILLLAEKYDIKTAVYGDALLRYYNGASPNRRGYGFPLAASNDELADIIKLLKQDSKDRNVPMRFCLCDEKQAAALNLICDVDWKCCDDDSDYIYKRDSLASLAGKKLHRKRNHINSFYRAYDNARYVPLTKKTACDAVKVAELWYAEHEPDDAGAQLSELAAIRKALVDMDTLGITGGVLYVGDTPAAMTAVSAYSSCCIDVIYEKSYGEYAENGAFTVINNLFAASDAADREYINREEDMGIPGLRTAKESYFPAFRLKKYYGVCK